MDLEGEVQATEEEEVSEVVGVAVATEAVEAVEEELREEVCIVFPRFPSMN